MRFLHEVKILPYKKLMIKKANFVKKNEDKIKESIFYLKKVETMLFHKIQIWRCIN